MPHINKVRPDQKLDFEQYNILVDAINWLMNIRVDGLSYQQTAAGIVMGAEPRSAAEGFFYAKITGNTTVITGRKFTYKWEEVEQTSAGYNPSDWSLVSGGKTSTTTSTEAKNLAEIINTATGQLGNGVYGNHIISGFNFMPAPTGLIVEMRERTLSDGSVHYWFTHLNAIDGSC